MRISYQYIRGGQTKTQIREVSNAVFDEENRKIYFNDSICKAFNLTCKVTDTDSDGNSGSEIASVNMHRAKTALLRDGFLNLDTFIGLKYEKPVILD